MFYAFYYNNLFPEQVFNISRSIEIILGPIIGGIGTLFGPILGAFLLTGLAEGSCTGCCAFGLELPGAKQVFYGVCLLRGRDGAAGWRVAVARAPARRRGATSHDALLSIERVSKRFRGLIAVDNVSFAVPAGDDLRRHRAERRRQDHAVQHDRRRDGAGRRRDHLCGQAHRRAVGRTQICRRGIARTFQLVRPFPALTRRGQRHHRRAAAPARCRRRAPARAGAAAPPRPVRQARSDLASTLTLPDRKRLEVARALATGPQLLLLDEVMAGLRPTETDRMVAILRELNRDSGLTILLIEHVMRAVMALAQRVLVLHHGAAIAEGTPEAVVRDPAVVQSYLGAEAHL